MNKQNYAAKVLVTMFERGIETYDRETKELGNIGGLGFRFRRGGWTNPLTSGVTIFNQTLKDLIGKAQARVFTLDRVPLVPKEEGSDELVPAAKNEEGYYPRENSMFCLYMTLDQSPATAISLRDHVIKNMPELAPYICTFGEVSDQLLAKGVAVRNEEGDIVLPDIQVRDVLGLHAAQLHSFVLFALPSGAEGSGSYWGFHVTEKSVSEVPATAADAVPVV